MALPDWLFSFLSLRNNPRGKTVHCSGHSSVLFFTHTGYRRIIIPYYTRSTPADQSFIPLPVIAFGNGWSVFFISPKNPSPPSSSNDWIGPGTLEISHFFEFLGHRLGTKIFFPPLGKCRKCSPFEGCIFHIFYIFAESFGYFPNRHPEDTFIFIKSACEFGTKLTISV